MIKRETFFRIESGRLRKRYRNSGGQGAVIRLGTVQQHLHRCLIVIRQKIDDQGIDDDDVGFGNTWDMEINTARSILFLLFKSATRIDFGPD
jgi:hypothetical protein